METTRKVRSLTFIQYLISVFRERMEGKVCGSPGCDQPAKLQCPTCIKLNIQGSFFCTQECFKANWKLHKNLHKLANTNNACESSKVIQVKKYTAAYLIVLNLIRLGVVLKKKFGQKSELSDSAETPPP